MSRRRRAQSESDDDSDNDEVSVQDSEDASLGEASESENEGSEDGGEEVGEGAQGVRKQQIGGPEGAEEQARDEAKRPGENAAQVKTVKPTREVVHRTSTL